MDFNCMHNISRSHFQSLSMCNIIPWSLSWSRSRAVWMCHYAGEPRFQVSASRETIEISKAYVACDGNSIASKVMKNQTSQHQNWIFQYFSFLSSFDIAALININSFIKQSTNHCSKKGHCLIVHLRFMMSYFDTSDL